MIKITNEDNMELMARYEDNYFDLAIVDPPYGIGISSNPVRQQHEKKDWDSAIPTKEYFKELLGFLKIKLFGVEIILTYHLHKVFLYGIKNNHTILV